MNIHQMYSDLGLPKNLQQHMVRVAAVGEFLVEKWQGPRALQKNDIVMTLLLHDLGNLLKFDLQRGMGLFEVSEQDQEYWIMRQRAMREKYGSSVHDATLQMAKELGASPRILELLEGMGSSRLLDTIQGEDWEQKICSYSDLRVDPHGFVLVEERFSDILTRYFDHGVTRWSNTKEMEREKERTLQNCVDCLELEVQLQGYISVDLQNLPEQDLENRAKDLLESEKIT